MSRGLVGESKESIAYNKIEKALKHDKTPYKKQHANLLESLQAMYPTTWKEVLNEMRREYTQSGPYVPPKQIVI